LQGYLPIYGKDDFLLQLVINLLIYHKTFNYAIQSEALLLQQNGIVTVLATKAKKNASL